MKPLLMAFLLLLLADTVQAAEPDSLQGAWAVLEVETQSMHRNHSLLACEATPMHRDWVIRCSGDLWLKYCGYDLDCMIDYLRTYELE